MSRPLAARINQLALFASLLVFVAIGVLWWRDRARVFEIPRWDPARFSAVAAPADRSARRAMVLAVHLDCSHCRERLAQLVREGAADSCGAAFGVLLVDERERPAAPEGGSRFAAGARYGAGVWWDSASVWRRAWGRRVYGETYLFAADGHLERVIAPDRDWRAPPSH